MKLSLDLKYLILIYFKNINVPNVFIIPKIFIILFPILLFN